MNNNLLSGLKTCLSKHLSPDFRGVEAFQLNIKIKGGFISYSGIILVFDQRCVQGPIPKGSTAVDEH